MQHRTQVGLPDAFSLHLQEKGLKIVFFQLLRLPWTVPVSLRNGSQNWSEAVHVIAHLALITQEHSVGELLGLADLTASLSDGALPGDRGIEALDGEHELRECVRFLDIGTPDLNHLPIVSIFLLLFFVVFLLLKENIFGFGGRCFFFLPFRWFHPTPSPLRLRPSHSRVPSFPSPKS